MNENQKKRRRRPIEDDEFIRGKVPMTKKNIRRMILDYLWLTPQSLVLDIGAGTGSVSIEIARLVKEVTAVEYKKEALELLEANREKFDCPNMEILQGKAPDCLPEKDFDAIFIGGNKGQLEGICQYSFEHLKIGGRLVATMITLENINELLETLTKYGMKDIEAYQIQVSNYKKIGGKHLLMAENPVTLIAATKEA